jgi:thymidylate kinase
MRFKPAVLVLEGPDDTGKTSAAAALEATLRREGHLVTRASLPGHAPGSLGQLVYEIHHGTDPLRIPRPQAASLQLLHVAAQLETLRRTIVPAISAGHLVILDRFWWSAVVYGRVAGVDEPTLHALESISEHHWQSVPVAACFLFLQALTDEPSIEQRSIAAAFEDFIIGRSLQFPVHRVLRGQSIEERVREMTTVLEVENPSPVRGCPC